MKGEWVSMTVAATGDPAPAYLWYFNGKPIPETVLPTYTVQAAALKDAGLYTCVAKNSRGSITSTPVRLVVVDETTQELPVYLGKPAKLTPAIAGAEGPAVWKKDGQTLSDTQRLKDTDKMIPTITQAREEDFGLYSCQVTTSVGSLTASMLVVPVDQVPVIVQPDWLRQDTPPAAGQIGYTFSDQIQAEHYPSKFIITGLPPGLKADPLTGMITGRFTKAGTYQVKLSALNPLGTGPVLILPMVVAPLPAEIYGSFVGLTPGHDSNQGLGGLTNITVTPTGGYTAKVQMGARSYSFSGQLASDYPSGQGFDLIGVSRSGAGHSTVWLQVILEGSTYGTVTLSLTQGAAGDIPLVTMDAYQCLTSDREGRAGYHTFNLTGGPASGASFGTATVSAKAVASATLRMMDGTTLTLGGGLTSGGALISHKLLYGNTGFLAGSIRFQPQSSSTSGSMDWFKPRPLRPGRLLPEGINGSVSISGGIWSPVQKTFNAGVKSGTATLESAFSDTFVVKSGSGSGFHPASDEYPARLTAFSLNAATGVFTGSVKLAYPVGSEGDPPRFLYHTAPVQGVITPGSSGGEISGEGWYHMPEPPDLLASPPGTLSNSRINPLGISFSGSPFSSPPPAP